MPAISAGIFGYPLGEAAAVIASACVAWAGEHPGALGEIRLVGFNETVEEAFAAALGRAEDPIPLSGRLSPPAPGEAGRRGR